MMLGQIKPALLEDWLRDRYFTADIDISSSGMAPYSLGQLRQAFPADWPDLDDIVMRDSPSLGTDRLRQAIAARFAPAHADRVMVTTGSSEAIFLALSALIRPGDEVVVIRPAYQSLVSIAEALGAALRFWDLAAERDFQPDLDRLATLLTPATAAVVVNFPHNPTGATLTPDQYEQLIGMVSTHGCHLVWDGAFTELTYDEAPLPEPTNALERCVSTGTMSKAYGLPGIRVGWCFAPPKLLAEMVRIRDYLTLNVCPINQTVAAAVLENADTLMLQHRAHARRGRALLTDWAHDRDIVSLPIPRGGVCAFPALHGLSDTTELSARLADDDGVLVVPGRCFGHPRRVRIGFGGPVEELRAGLRLLETASRAARTRNRSI